MFDMRRREFITLLGGAVAWPIATRAEQRDRMRRIGVLVGSTVNDPQVQAGVAAFTKALQELGWADGRNIQVDYRGGAGDADKYQTLARELVAAKPDLILAGSTPALAALRQETRALPIVFMQVTDPVAQGFVASLDRPDGNITGLSHWEGSMGGKWLELLKEVAPRVARVALVFNPKTAPYFGLFLPSMEAAASSFALNVTATPVHDVLEIENAFTTVGREPDGGLVVMSDAFTTAHRRRIIELAAELGLPAIYSFRYFASDGGLMSYGVDGTDIWRRSALYVDRILKGAKPTELPIQFPTKFELVINLKTAKALGLEVPPTLLARADEVIE
jgi:putative ABC transport system substrate-binding protein